MIEHEVELSVGQILQIGELTVTILDIDGDQVHLQIDNDGTSEPEDAHRDMVLAIPR